jgi:2-amino-4-hydroxy-6-hydroxymethyldihydropteridine diphosphokinase
VARTTASPPARASSATIASSAAASCESALKRGAAGAQEAAAAVAAGGAAGGASAATSAPRTPLVKRARWRVKMQHPMRATAAYVGIGSNLGDREATIARALELLDDPPAIRLARVATVRETAPVGVVDQPAFLNTVALVETTLGPRELLGRLLTVERSLGRVRTGERWGPRTVDLDLLLHGDAALDEPGLTLPHPRLHERRFVLEPLYELAPDLLVPGRGRVSELLSALD